MHLTALACVSALLALSIHRAHAADGPGPPVVLLQDKPVGIVIIPDGSHRFYNRRDPTQDVRLPTPDGTVVEIEPRIDFAIPRLDRYPARLLMDRKGDLHEIAMKRLLDGQFDQCGLTLRQLRTIEDSLVKSLTAMYHSRVKYPDQQSA